MTTTEIKTKMLETLKKAGLGYEDIKVFGAIRCNVHVVCVSRDTADKWAMLLAGVFKGSKVALVSHVWNAVEQKGTCLKPTMRKGFLIAVAG